MEFHNTYEDEQRATAYDELGLGGTYHLAFRDLAALLRKHVVGKSAIDFGCGTGRSTRFLGRLGFRCVGLDVASAMVSIARARDPHGSYRVIEDGDFSALSDGTFDLVLSAFTFDNIPGRGRRSRLLSGLRKLLSPHGRLINIVSSPELYSNEWVTFTTRDFPENAKAGSGDIVRVVTTDYSDARPVEDVLWRDRDYLALFREAGLEPERIEKPLATGEEGIAWVSETRIPPWTIHVLRPIVPSARLKIRRATTADAQAISGVLAQSFAEYEEKYTPAAFRATTPSPAGVLARLGEGPCWVGELDSEVVATAAATVTPAGCYVRGMGVVTQARRVRAGWGLLDTIEQFAREREAARLYLSTTPFLQGAVRLYHRYGFRRIEEGPTDLLGTPLYSMQKVLSLRPHRAATPASLGN